MKEQWANIWSGVFPQERTSRSPDHALAHLIHRRTDGNPLFMVNVTNELVHPRGDHQRDGQWVIPGTLGDGHHWGGREISAN